MSAAFRMEALAGHHRTAFDCGQTDLNRYFHTQVGQDIRRHLTNCFVAVHVADDVVAGF
jgi:hypothetical protein